MGLLLDILAAPVMLPVKGLFFIFDKIKEQVDHEMLDEGKIQQQLLEVQMLFELGEIPEEEFHQAEEMLLDRLDAIIAYKEGLEDEAEVEDAAARE